MRIALLLLSLGASGATAQPSLILLVRNAETRRPLAGARLDVGGVGGAADLFGAAELVGINPGPLRVRASYPRYVSVDTTVMIVEGTSAVVVLTLRPDAVVLGDVVVEAESINYALLRRRGFFERRESRTGVFLTREELDQRGASMFSDVFRGVAGVRIERRRGLSALVSTRRQGCLMSIYVDGTEAAFLASAVDNVPLDDVAAVEVYRGPAEVPIEYSRTRSSQTCGAVLVWTLAAVGE